MKKMKNIKTTIRVYGATISVSGNGDITNDVEEIEDATSADTEKNGLGVVVMGAIIIGLGVIFMYSRSKKRQQH